MLHTRLSFWVRLVLLRQMSVLVGVQAACFQVGGGHSVGMLCTQVLQEAEQVFGASEQEPSRDAAEGMQYTMACLKVQHNQLSLCSSPLQFCCHSPGLEADQLMHQTALC